MKLKTESNVIITVGISVIQCASRGDCAVLHIIDPEKGRLYTYKLFNSVENSVSVCVCV